MTKILSCIFIALLYAAQAVAQGLPVMRFYSPEEYNSFEQVWDVVQDSNAFMHFTTGEGGLTFNGQFWEGYHVGERGRGSALHRSTNDRIYMSGEFGFGHLDSDSLNRVRHRIMSDGISNTDNQTFNEHNSIIELDDVLYMYGQNGLDVVKGESISFFELQNRSPIIFSLNGSIYVGQPNGISEFREDQFYFVSGSESFADRRLTFAIPFDSRRTLLGYADGELILFNGRDFEVFETEADEYLKEHYLFSGLFINEEIMALGTISGGLIKLNRYGEIQYVYNTNTGYSLNGILSMDTDEEGNLWLAQWGGIEKIVNAPIQYVGESLGLTGAVLEIAEHHNKMYAQTAEGLMVGELLEFENVYRFRLHPNTKVQTSSIQLVQVQNRLFIQTPSELLEITEEHRLESLMKGAVMPVNQTDESLIYFIDQDEILAGESGENTMRFEMPATGSIREAVRYKGWVFLRNNSEIIAVNNQRSISIPVINDTTKTSTLLDIEITSHGLLLAVEGDGNNSGLYLLNENEKHFEPFGNLLRSDADFGAKQTLSVTECANGDLWVFNDFEIKRVITDGNDFSIKKGAFSLIKKRDPINAITCGKESVWFGGLKGLYQLRDSDWEYTTLFKTNITNVFVRNDSLIYGGFGQPSETAVLPYRDNMLRFNFAAGSYSDESRTEYSYRLSGFEDSWSSWTDETQKDYTNIPEGEYDFQVRSKNVFDAEGTIASFKFEILPPWYRTWWAYLFYMLIAFGALYTAYKIRVNQLLRVERMRTKIASDLHDEVSATLTGISFFARALQMNTSQEKKDHFIQLISESAGEAKEKITDIVWSINPENDSWELFLAKCRRYASDLMESGTVEYEINIPENASGSLNMAMRQHLWMIIKELLTNIVRHSHADKMKFDLKISESQIQIEVLDNGMGFDVNSPLEGNGVKNIKKRVHEMNGSVELNSEEGTGTHWLIRIEL